jgi:cytoskeletal protein CcmA (bactofilin family)
MFAKSKSVREDWKPQPLQGSAVTQSVAMPRPSETISSIGSEMTVIGKIICKGVLKIYGLVEGEVIASNALIAEGARIQGDIVAEELTIGGRVNGSIHALRVKLQTTAVVEGDIFHRSLSIDEHAWFEGCSRPEDDPPEPRASIKAESSNPQPRQQALVAFDDHGELIADFTAEEPTQRRHSGRHAVLAACIAIIAIGMISHFALSALQQPTGLAFTTDNVRLDPGWMESTQLGWTELPPSPKSIAVRASIPETSQTATVATAPETVAPKADAAFFDSEQVPQMPQSFAAPSQTVEQLAAGRAQIAREETEPPAADVEILAKIPVPRQRPTAASGRKSMPGLPRSARALITPPSPRIPPRYPHQ